MDESPTLRSAAEDLFDNLTVLPPPIKCSRCDSGLLHLNATFFSSGGKVWTIPLPICPKCDL